MSSRKRRRSTPIASGMAWRGNSFSSASWNASLDSSSPRVRQRSGAGASLPPHPQVPAAQEFPGGAPVSAPGAVDSGSLMGASFTAAPSSAVADRAARLAHDLVFPDELGA